MKLKIIPRQFESMCGRKITHYKIREKGNKFPGNKKNRKKGGRKEFMQHIMLNLRIKKE